MVRISTDFPKIVYHPERITQWKKEGDCFPIMIETSPTNRCNHNCVFCALDWIEHGTHDIDSSVMINALEYMARNGLKSYYTAGEGEPFLHKDMCLFLKKAKELGLESSISTNAIPLTEEKISQSVPYLSWMRFSFNAGSPETYAKIHRTKPQDFHKALKNIENAVRFRDENKLSTIFGLQLVMLPMNKNEIGELAQRLKDIGVDNFQLKPYSHHPGSTNDFFLTPEDYKKIGEEALKFDDNKFQVIFRGDAVKRTYSEEERPYNKCRGLPFFVLIDCRGNVIPCSHFYKSPEFFYGNLYEQSFSEIWNGEKRKQVLGKIQNRGINECRRGCRLDLTNRYLEEIKNPPSHNSFL